MNRSSMPDKRKGVFGLSKQAFLDIIVALYFLLFLYAAAAKLLEYDKFKLQIAKSPYITDYALTLVWLVPAAEIVIAVMLVVPRLLVFGLYSALALMGMFTVYIVAILNFSDFIPCSCGGILERMSWSQHLVFNIFFVLLAVVGIMLQSGLKEKR